VIIRVGPATIFSLSCFMYVCGARVRLRVATGEESRNAHVRVSIK
jgi:hypothetical protein